MARSRSFTKSKCEQMRIRFGGCLLRCDVGMCDKTWSTEAIGYFTKEGIWILSKVSGQLGSSKLD